ncbi:YadA-like family protein [Enterobacter cloacae complex sp.6701062]|uniref:YadA-like family protein n=1 Tax=Enterobacter cloacae complex TaxID=354276 RepID=UPI00223511E2|nr:YadA-like family protein [Enterobacter hormaechei]MDF3793868.1 YadA-like family protein [Enterobacter hormaechei]MDF3804022.1 YadA-like family protein [Enterobacter hormaechei]MDJ1448602.1 YadA-like family protein [Enterobacter hormaechei subsp. xiangfangensis]MDR9949899.1 YadA-like family protein [Enterobacter hormaechei subsp. xiangfangensis]MDS0079865.1 YadA-like family protein [Enterobacter hormaechei subsp. xiangfangensis]
MKSMNKNFTAIFVMGIVLAGTMSQAEAANTVWDDQQITNIVNDHQDLITQNNADSINRDSATDNRLTQVNDDLQSTKLGVLVVDKMANDAHQKALLAGALADTASLKSETALQGVATNGTAIINLQHVDNIQDSRLTALENAPKPINGADGAKGDKGDTGATGAKGDKGDTGVTGAKGEKGDAGATGMKGDKGDTGAQGIAGRNGRDGADGHNGKDGVTTTVTQRQLDTATQAKVAKNSMAVTAATQDLQATRQSLQAMNTNTSQQFKSLRDEVDNNKKQANAGISGAMAMAGLPQVQTNQRVMFSAGGATYNGESALAVGASVNFNSHVIAKVSFSDDTANNMGASVGIGMGF